MWRGTRAGEWRGGRSSAATPERWKKERREERKEEVTVDTCYL
jgi:hypothetical protein